MLLTQNRDPKGFAAVYGLSHTRMCWGGCGGCGFSWDLGFCVSLQQAEMELGGGCLPWPQVTQGEPSRVFLGIILLFASFAQIHDYCHQKKPFGEKKKSVTVGSISWVTFSFSPATSFAVGVMPLVFPTPFPGGCQNQGDGWEQGGSSGVPTTAKSSFGGGWQGGLSLFIWAEPLYSHGCLTRHAVNSWSPQTEEALAYLYCVLASAP